MSQKPENNKKNVYFFFFDFFLEEVLALDDVAKGGSGFALDGSIATSGSNGWGAATAGYTAGGWSAASCAASGWAEVLATAAGVGIEGSEASLGLILLSMIKAK